MTQGGESSIIQRIPYEVETEERFVRAPETLKHVNSSETVASTSNGQGRTEKTGHDVLPKEMHGMKIRDDKTDVHDDNGKV